MRPLLQLLRRPLLHVAGFSFFINLLLLVPALFMLQVFDRVLVSGSLDTLVLLLVGAAIGLVLLGALDYVRGRLQDLAGHLVAQSLSPVVTQLMLAQGARRSGQVGTEGLRDIGTLRSLFSAQGLLALFDTPWIVVYVAIIWVAHGWLGATALMAAALMLLLAVANDRLTRHAIESLQKATAGATRYLETSLANAEVVQSLGMAHALIARWREKSADAATLQGPAAHRTLAMAALTRTLRQSVQVIMLAVGAWLVVTGQGSPGITVACTILLGRALAPVEQVVGSWRLLAEGRAALGRLSELMDTSATKAPTMPLPPPRGELSVHQAVYRAPRSDRLLLSGVSLHLKPGESLAIIGPSGAGKSTLLRLVTGLWAPLSGVVRLDGADLAQWPREQLGPWLGYVPQDVELFPGTVAENIARLGEVDSEQVVRAAQRARVHDLILQLPEGYDTWVDPQGALLSPGQRQRIALARGLYGDPRLLVLDEPNSNLDGSGEQALAQALKDLRGEVTVVVVTHRTSLVQQVDQLMVIEGGKPVHYGPVAEVLKAMQAKARPASEGGTKVVAMPTAAAVMEKNS
jgi:PrtD family type I secretion system ABC transporter